MVGFEREEWRKAVGLEAYLEVSDAGRVRSVTKPDALGRIVCGKVLSPHLSGRYMRVRIRTNHHIIERSVHALVLEAFIGPRPVGMHGCHNDGDVRNNRLANLRWDTASANQRDKIVHGTIACGERNGFSKLTESDVREIRRLISVGVGPTAIGRQFGVAREYVQQIRKGRTWRHIA